MARVLLVDDSAYVASFFAVQLWDEHQLDVVTTAAQIPSLHPTTHGMLPFPSLTPKSNRSASGLTALKHLQGRVTHPVAFTGSGESGRGLFNIAANRWFGVRVIIDKSDARPLTAIVSSLLRATILPMFASFATGTSWVLPCRSSSAIATTF